MSGDIKLKTTNLLLIAGAVFLGYKLAPEEVKEQLTGGGGSTVVSISENPVDWSKLSGIITAPISEMPLPSMPEWFTKPPDWLDKVKDITLPKLPDVIPHIPSIEEIIDKIKFPAMPDMPDMPSIEEIIDKIKFPAMPDMPDDTTTGGFWDWLNNLKPKDPIGDWLSNLEPKDPIGDWLSNLKPKDPIGDWLSDVVPRPEASFGRGAPIITEAALVPHTPVFSGRAPKYTAFMPMEHPGIKGVSIVGVLSGSPTPIGTLTGSLPPAKAKPWMFT